MSGRARRTVTFALLAALAVAVLVAAGLTVPGSARADDTCSISWKSGTGSWSDPTRWSPARVPTGDDDVCVVRAAGADPMSVRITATTDVQHLTLRGATFSVPPDAFFDVRYLDASRATLTGGGAIRGSTGIVDLTDTQLRGVHLSTGGGLRLGGQITFTGGSTVDASGFTDPRPGVRIVDADGNGANHVTVSNFPLYLFGPVFVGVGLELRDVSLFAQRDGIVLARLDNLDSAGRLHASSRSDLQVGATDGATLTLPRSITSIARGTTVFASGDVRTPDGGDALAALTTLDGTLSLGGDAFVAGGSITVRGRLTAAGPLVAPDIQIRPGGYFAAERVTGSLTCGGQCSLAGAHVGRLVLESGATVDADLTTPIRVDGAARLGGRLDLLVPRRVAAGAEYVLVTAGGGVRGTFAQVTSSWPSAIVVPAYRPTYVTGTVHSNV